MDDAQPAAASQEPGWRDSSAFDALDESWAETPAATQRQDDAEQPRPSEPDNAQDTAQSEPVLEKEAHIDAPSPDTPQEDRAATPTEATRKSDALSGEATDATSPQEHDDARTSVAEHTGIPTQSDDGVCAQRQQQRTSSPMSDSELLQPGPSSPSHRILSHQMPSLDSSTASTSTAAAAATRPVSMPTSPSRSSAFHDLPSPVRSARSASTSSSGEKQGARLSFQLYRPDASDDRSRGVVDAPHGDDLEGRHTATSVLLDPDDQFGSALESVSTTDGVAGAPFVEATFIEHSDVISPPPFLKPKWKNERPKDIFAPLALQTMFEPPSPSFDAAQARDERLDSSTPESSKGTVIEATREQQPSEHEEGREETREMIRDETRSESGAMQSARSSESKESTRNIEEPKEANTPSDPVQSPEPTTGSSGSNNNGSANSSGQVELAARVDIPQCTFTFSSPVPRPKRPPPTPSTSRAPLRLFHLQGRGSEIEQILNTPRSAAKTRDAKRIVWTLVEEEEGIASGGREKKRLRMDRMPSPAPVRGIGLDSSGTDNAASPQRRGGIRRTVAPSPLRMQSGSSPRRTLSSSLIVKRTGASAPTPDRARHRLLQVEHEESPRKLLRRWSAANMVDEEIEEGREAERSTDDERDVWQDVVEEEHPSDNIEIHPSTSPGVPSVSINPAQSLPSSHSVSSQLSIPSLDLHSPEQPDNVMLRDMDVSPDGRKVYNAHMKRWIRIRTPQKAAIGTFGGDDANDPFRDLGSAGDNARPALRTTTASNAGHGRSQHSDKQGQLALPTSPWSPQQRLHTPAKPAGTSLRSFSVTPRSILKGKMPAPGDVPNGQRGTPTPMRQTMRKISFADGINPRNSTRSTRSISDSARRQRVNNLLGQLQRLAMHSDIDDMEEREDGGAVAANEDEDELVFADRSPTPQQSRDTTMSTTVPSIGQRSPWNLSMLRPPGRRSRAGEKSGQGGASFMTNASFNEAHDRLLELLTDVAPWTANWTALLSIDLRGRRVESVARLHEFLPKLEEALLDDNEISYLTGLPSTLRRLSIARNHLPSTASFGVCVKLQSLNVTGNNVDLKALRNLVHLQHLYADSNGITSVEGVEHLDKLRTLHLRDNAIETLELEGGQWPELRELVLSHNVLMSVEGIGMLSRLRCLNLDHNQLHEVDLGIAMPKLKQLRVSYNADLNVLDVGPAYNLRTLYADACALDEVRNVGVLQKLDNLSLRQQNGERGLHWPAHEVRDVKRLFLSGNAFRAVDLSARATPSMHPSGITQFFGLVYLELSGCQLTSLPDELGEMVPNLRQLNADYNLLETLPSMRTLRRLKHVSLVGCRISKTRTLVERVTGCEELEFLDVRMNPCTLGLYPPILVVVAPNGGKNGERKLNRAFLPPIPHPLYSAGARSGMKAKGPRADAEEEEVVEDDERVGMGSMAEKSYFHKRRPAPPILGGKTPNADDPDQEGAEAALFAATDARFVRTLPPHFRLQRLLHRGTLAMACQSMGWLDGLEIDEEEVLEAAAYLRRKADATASAHLHVRVATVEEGDKDSPTSASVLSSSSNSS